MTADLTKELAAIQDRSDSERGTRDRSFKPLLVNQTQFDRDRLLYALQAVVELLERDEAASSHNEGLSIAQVADLMPRPTPEEYRRAIEQAVEAGA